MSPRFIQIHTLTSYSASLLNRDDAGFAKRLPFGGVTRTRVSSQCLKRHWRTADDDQAIDRIQIEDGLVPMSVRSRHIFSKYIYEILVADGINNLVAHAATKLIKTAVLPKSKAKQNTDGDSKLKTREVIILGRPELDYLLSVARELTADGANEKQVEKNFDKLNKGKDFKANLAALNLGSGLDAALFGRMTTGDILARTDAAVHVAHSFTVHEGQFETDYFTALDDLQKDSETDLQNEDVTGSAHLNTSELSTGLFYGYVVIDVPLLVSNLEGCERSSWQNADKELAVEVIKRFIQLVATISPGAKLGSTAPYANASMVLVEVGGSQPRSLSNAFLHPVPLSAHSQQFLEVQGYDVVKGAYAAIARFLDEHDKMYAGQEERRIAVQSPSEELLEVAGSRLDLTQLVSWLGEQISI